MFKSRKKGSQHSTRAGFFLVLTAIVFFLMSCSLPAICESQEEYIPTEEIQSDTPTPTMTVTPEIPTSTATPSIERWVTISATQEPYKYDSPWGEEEGLLYNQTYIYFFNLGTQEGSVVYVNLDDLDDSTTTNSDLVFTRGLENTYSFDAANGASYYLSSTKAGIGYDYCLSHYPLLDYMTQSEYDAQKQEFIRSYGYYCIYTNENRIATMRLDLTGNQIKYPTAFSISVIVYEQKFK